MVASRRAAADYFSMRRKAIILIATVAVVLLGFAAVRIIDSTADNNRRAEAEVSFEGVVAEVKGDGVCEVLVDIGVVPCSSTTTTVIRLVNRGSEPLVLLDYTTQCRCMWLEFEREPIAVGGSCEVTLCFDSRGEWGSVGNYMEITTSREASPIVLWIGAQVE